MNYSVIEVMQSMGIKPNKQLSWTVGSTTRAKWEKTYGRLPDKELRPKTNGNGSHCFAVYPGWFKKEIKRIVKQQLQFRDS